MERTALSDPPNSMGRALTIRRRFECSPAPTSAMQEPENVPAYRFKTSVYLSDRTNQKRAPRGLNLRNALSTASVELSVANSYTHSDILTK